jgi:serine/threonine-protein kinase RsbW
MSSPQSLTLPAFFHNVTQLCDFMLAGATQAGFDDRDRFRLQLACDEACTNIIEHAYGGENKGDITISWHIIDTHFIVSLFDTGQPFQPDSIPEPQLPIHKEDVENLQVGGLGLSMIRKIMDEVVFEFENAGNSLHLKKQLPPSI